jgi:Apea-like HEPN
LAEIRALLRAVEAIPALEFFSNAYQCALGQFESIDFRFLVSWLISRGQQVGAAQSVEDLTRYLEVETIEVTIVLAVDGIHVESTVKFDGCELIDWAALALTDTKWHISARSALGGRLPSAAVTRKRTIKRTHVRPWSGQGPNLPEPIEPALDTLRCVTAVAGAGFRLLHYWFEPEEWAPWAPSHSTFGVNTTSMPRPVKIGVSAASQVSECVANFSRVDDRQKSRLRVPLDRLNRSYLAGMLTVEKAIELGIALESLYAPAKLSEGIAFAVRSRAARFLGGSPDDRRETFSILKDVYDLRSLAVHAGRFDTKEANKKWRDEAKVREALDKGQKLVGRSLVKVIEEGEPNWEELDLGIYEGKQAAR